MRSDLQIRVSNRTNHRFAMATLQIKSYRTKTMMRIREIRFTNVNLYIKNIVKAIQFIVVNANNDIKIQYNYRKCN